jgi:wyosine [tRNA(Phe)-imidazoG37] synthetase (radical SAM superfamily)
MIAFGPIPSRRLGRSLGINNIPPKICSYSCVYCQLGRTLKLQTERQRFYSPEEIFQAVDEKTKAARRKKEPIDFLTFVPDGEPTLDLNLGKEIEQLKVFGRRIAVISNSSLIWDKDVRADLNRADWVSLKIDALSEATWRKINRPHKALRWEQILEGIKAFARDFKGFLATETMLIQGLNDDPQELEKIAEFIRTLRVKKSYILIPTRPPAESWARPANERFVAAAYELFQRKAISTEYLIGYEGDAFAFTGNAEEDLLSITSVHPMREEAVRAFLEKARADWDVVRRLIQEDQLIEVEYENKKFYLRKLRSPRKK